MSPEPAGPARPATGSRHSPALLDMLADTALDADYAAVAARAAGQVGPPGSTGSTGTDGPRRRARRPGVRLLGVVALGLVVATGVVQTARSEPAARQGRADLVTQLTDGEDALAARRTRVAALQRDLTRLALTSGRLVDEDTRAALVAARVDRLAAATPRSGAGLVVVADDAPGATSVQERVLDKDLQRLVNAFWAAGAEAISLAGVRLTALSAIRTAGSAVTVDYRSVRAPYELLVLGDPNGLQTRFVGTTHGQYWFDLQQAVGVTLDLRPVEELTVPAARRLTVREARAGGSGSDSGSDAGAGTTTEGEADS